MSTAVFNAASARAIPLRMRRDLIVREPGIRGEGNYVVKDPLTLKHFQLRAEEFALLRWLDGRVTYVELKRMFESRFVPARLSLSRLQILLARFYRDGLVLTDAPHQGARLYEQHEQAKHQSQWQSWLNVLAIRFRGVNPDRFLTRLHDRIDWLFHPIWFWISLCVIAFSGLFLLVHAVPFAQRIEELSNVIQPHNLVWMALTLSCIKVLHELAHGLTCKHFRGECNELGIMLLVFSPCIYCNVSDAWMIPDRTKRAAVAAAGMYVEVFIAAVCFLLWWYTAPGTIHALCLNVMVVASVGTVLFNGNPLLRYDGYFILSDLCDQPNLWQLSRQVLQQQLRRICFGIDSPTEETTTLGTWWLGLYGLISATYRSVMLCGILLFLMGLLRDAGLHTIGYALVAFIIASAVIPPAIKGVGWLRNPSKPRIKLTRFFFLIVLLLLAASLILWLPLPASVSGPAIIRIARAQGVYVVVPGQLVDAVSEGTSVQQGAILGHLRSIPLELELAKLRSDRNQRALHLEQLEGLQGSDPKSANDLPTAREQLAAAEEALLRGRENFEHLTLRAPQAGIVLAARSRFVEPRTEPVAYRQWEGHPLQNQNLGCLLERGTLVCEIGDPSHFEAMVYIPARDAALLRPGQSLAAQTSQVGSDSVSGQVVEISNGPVPELPAELFARQRVGYRANAHGQLIPLEPMVEVRVELETGSCSPPHQTLGEVKIQIEPRTLGARLKSLIEQTFVDSVSQE